jgi:adenosylcobinamide-GDP ribazoletransferase
MTHLRIALSFLTILPVGPKHLSERLAPATLYFPLVGLLLGLGLWGLDAGLRVVFPVAVTSALLLVGVTSATRALHVDGFLDSCDALFGAHAKERRLEILRDPHVGAFAVIGGASLLLVQWSALSALPSAFRPEAFLLFPCLSRWAMQLAMTAFPYARPEGLGAAFQRGRHPLFLCAGFALAAAASVLFAGWAGVAFLVIGTCGALLLGAWTARLLGGLTGDSYGAVNEVAATAVLLAAVAFARETPGLFDAPLALG